MGMPNVASCYFTSCSRTGRKSAETGRERTFPVLFPLEFTIPLAKGHSTAPPFWRGAAFGNRPLMRRFLCTTHFESLPKATFVERACLREVDSVLIRTLTLGRFTSKYYVRFSFRASVTVALRCRKHFKCVWLDFACSSSKPCPCGCIFLFRDVALLLPQQFSVVCCKIPLLTISLLYSDAQRQWIHSS